MILHERYTQDPRSRGCYSVFVSARGLVTSNNRVNFLYKLFILNLSFIDIEMTDQRAQKAVCRRELTYESPQR